MSKLGCEYCSGKNDKPGWRSGYSDDGFLGYTQCFNCNKEGSDMQANGSVTKNKGISKAASGLPESIEEILELGIPMMHREKATHQINALITEFCNEVIGEDNIASKTSEQGYVWRSTKGHYRNNLRAEQRAKLKELLK